MSLESVLKKNAEKNNSKPQVNADDVNDRANSQLQDIVRAAPARAPEVDPHLEVSNEEVQFLYSCPQSEAFTIHLQDGAVRAKNGVMVLDTAQHREVQTLIRKYQRFDISQNMILLDPTAAQEIARKHMEEQAQRKQASRGMTSTMQTKAQMMVLEGHNIPDGMRNLDVVELDATHVEDTKEPPVQ